MAKKKKEVVEAELSQLTEAENVIELENKVEMESTEPEISVELPELPKEIWVELPKVNVEELLLKHIDEQEGEEVELNEFFSKIHAKEDDYTAAKLTKNLLSKLVVEGKIKMSDVNWNDLDMHHYDATGKSKKYLISDIKILVKK